MTQTSPISLADQLAELDRLLERQRKLLTGWIVPDKAGAKVIGMQIARLEAARGTLAAFSKTVSGYDFETNN